MDKWLTIGNESVIEMVSEWMKLMMAWLEVRVEMDG